MTQFKSMFSLTLLALVLLFLGRDTVLSFSAHAQAPAPVILTSGEDEYPLGNNLEIMEDPTGALTIADVSAPEFDLQFVPNQNPELNLGLANTTYWLRFHVRNETTQTSEWWLEITSFELENVSVFYPWADGRGGFEEKQGGSLSANRDRDTLYYYPVFNLSIPPGTEQTIYMRVQSQRINLPLTLWSASGFNQETQKNFMILGLYWGILFIMAGYNFFIFLFLRDKSYLFYVLFIICLLAADLLRRYLPIVWPNELWANSTIITLPVATFLFIFLLQFTASFLLTKEHTPRLHRLFVWLQLGLALIAPISILWTEVNLFLLTWLLLILISITVVVIAGLIIWRQGYRPARYFVLGLAMLLASVFLSILAVLGFFPTSYTQFAGNYGVVLMAFLMSVALADRINIIKQEQEEAQASVVRNQQEMLRLKDEFAATLQQTNKALTHNIADREEAEAETRQRNRELILLNQVIATTTVAVEPETVLETTCRELVNAFHLSRATAVLTKETISTMEVVADAHSDDHQSIMGQSFIVKETPLLDHLATHKKPLIVEDAQEEQRSGTFNAPLDLPNVVSYLMVPLIVEKAVVGGVCLASTKPRQFSTNECDLVLSVAEQVNGALTRIHLIEQRQQLEAQYYQSQKMEAIGRLAGGIAHDFNNLLVPIMGYVELAMLNLTPDHPVYSNLEQVYKAAERAASLTRQILAFSRKQLLDIKPVNLNEVVTEFETMLGRLIGENIDLQTSLDPALHQVKVDRSQIEQILMNLAVNARDAMANEGKLIIETGNIFLDENYADTNAEIDPGPYVILSVSDNGTGMDAETQRRIFEPFFTTKERGKGTGLGLSTVHGIVKQHGGHILVYSEPGMGTAVKIYLPQAEESDDQSGPYPVEIDSLHGDETILLVEDEELVLNLTRRVLQTYGYQVLEAHDGEVALQLAAAYTGPIHLLLTDVIMPKMNGKMLADELTKSRPDLKVLYLSGYAEEMIRHQNVLEPGTNLLQKPFGTKELARKLRMVLENTAVD